MKVFYKFLEELREDLDNDLERKRRTNAAVETAGDIEDMYFSVC